MRVLPPALFLLLAAAASPALAVEPPCEYPTCFPGFSELYAKRVFTLGKERIELYPLGRFGPSIQTIYRLVDDKGAGSFKEAFVIEAADKKGYEFNLFAREASDTKAFRLDGPVDSATAITVSEKGKEARVFRFDEAATKKVKLAAMTRAYRQQVSYEEYAYYLSEAQPNMDKDLAELKAEYGVELKGVVDGSRIKSTDLDEDSIFASNVGYLCLDVVGAISAMCQREKCAQVKKGIKEFNCHLTLQKKGTATLKKGVFDVQIAVKQARDGRGSFNALEFLEQRLK